MYVHLLKHAWIPFFQYTTRKQAKGPDGISTGCKSSWYLWPAAIKGKGFGTGLKNHPVPKPQYRHRLVPQPVPKEQGGIGKVGGTNRCLYWDFGTG